MGKNNLQMELSGTEVKPGPKGPRGKDVIRIAGITLYSAEKIAERLGTTRQMIRKYIVDGDLKGQKIGGKWYISIRNFNHFLEKG
jgi:excisionase family DNA binding protein